LQLDINLFDPSLRPRKVLLPARVCAPVVAVAALLLLSCAVLQSREAQVAMEAKRLLEGRSTTLQNEIRQLSEQLGTRRASPELQARVAPREAMRTTREAAVAALRTEGANAHRGHARFLQALARQSIDGLWLTEVTVAGDGSDLALRGRTLDPELVADYLRRLGREDALRGLAFNQLVFQRPAATDAVAGASPRYLEFAATSAAGDGGVTTPQVMVPRVAPAATPPPASPDLAALAQTAPVPESAR